MAYFHGIYANEVPTSLIAPSQVDTGIVVAVGTAPTHLAQKPASVNKPVIAYKYSEAVEQLGYSDDFETYTLCQVMKAQFSLYNMAPVVFINVLDASKHYKEIEKEFSGVTSTVPAIKGENIVTDSFKVTSGEYIEPNEFINGVDFSILGVGEGSATGGGADLDGDGDDGGSGDSGETTVTYTLGILNNSKVVDNKIKISYRTLSTALGGSPIETEITVTSTGYTLPSDTVIESVTVQSGGVNTLQLFIEGTDFNVSVLDDTAAITILNDEKIVDGKIKVTYHELDASKVTDADIIGGVDIATGKTTGIELIESVHPTFGVIPGTLIAPKFSLSSDVTAALVAKAKKVSGIFPAIAISDIDTAECKTYTAAVEKKNNLNMASEYLITCYPKIKNGDDIYYMSTHLAALMNQVDNDNGGIPYVSPSNKALQMDAAVLEDGTEIFLTRDQANLLNQNGIVTALSFSGWKAWGNYTTIYPASNDVKDVYIPVRRMFNFLTNRFLTNYIAKLDMPVTRRLVDSILNSANIYLNGLVTKGCLLGGRLEFATDENTVTDLMNGSLTFHLYITPPIPAQTIVFTLEYDVNYVSSLLS